MSTNTAGFIACPGCGASYPFKPQLAGRKVRCKCGVAFEATPPRALPVTDMGQQRTFALREDAHPAAQSSPAAASQKAPGTSTPGLTTPTLENLMSPYPMHRRVRPVAQEEEPASRRKLAVVVAIMVLMIGGGIFMGVALRGGMLGSNKNLKGDDAKILGMIKDDGATEVREWINGNPRHMALHMTDGQVLAIADRAYALGAVKVLAFGETITASLAVEMPTDPAKRKALLEFEKEHNGGRTVQADVGQKYFLLRMM